MDRQFATISTKGQLVIPAEMRAALGIQPGTRISLAVENNRIILQAVTPELVKATKGMLAGGFSMADQLQKERRKVKW